MFCVGINKKMYKNSGKLHKCALNQYSIYSLCHGLSSLLLPRPTQMPPSFAFNQWVHTHAHCHQSQCLLVYKSNKTGKVYSIATIIFSLPLILDNQIPCVCVCITFSSVSWIKFYLLSQLTQRKMSFYLILLLTMCV